MEANSLPTTLIIILLNTILTAGLAAIGWLVNQLYSKIDQGNENGQSSHNKIFSKLEDVEEEVSEHSIVLSRVEDKVNGNREKIDQNHTRIAKLRARHGTGGNSEGQGSGT